MNFLRKAGSMFRKAPPVINQMFQKAKSLVVQVAPHIQHGIQQAYNGIKHEAHHLEGNLKNLARDGQSLAAQVSPNLAKLGHGLQQGSILAGQIANNPEVTNIKSKTFQEARNHVANLCGTLNRASGLANNASTFTNEHAYNKGSHEDNITHALQRAKAIH